MNKMITNSTITSRFPFLLLTLILLLFLKVSAFTITTKADDYFVLDSDGKKITNGGKYKLSVVVSDGSHDTEISVAQVPRWLKSESKLCWLTVVQSHDKGLPVTITNVIIKPDFVVTDFPVNVSFSDLSTTNCTDSSQWVLVNGYNPSFWKAVMVGDDDPQEFGHKFSKGYFYVKPYDAKKYEYYFVYCYRYGRDFHEECDNIGVRVDSDYDDLKRLVWTSDKPLVFKFHKVIITDDDETSFESKNTLLSMVV